MREHVKFLFMMLGFLLMLSGCGLLRKPEQASEAIIAEPLVVEESMTPGDDGERGGGSLVGTTVFTIVPGESTARFELEEDLRSALTGWALGARITVIGTTDQVAGEFALDFTELNAAQFGEIRINARTIETDEFFRNRAIQNQILHTETHEFLTFQPTRIEGLPDFVEVGESVTFNIIGDLTIRDITRTVAFTVTAALEAPAQIAGTASTVISREDYALTIPNVANVTYVEDEVELYIDFIARQKALN